MVKEIKLLRSMRGIDTANLSFLLFLGEYRYLGEIQRVYREMRLSKAFNLTGKLGFTDEPDDDSDGDEYGQYIKLVIIPTLELVT